MPGFLRQELLGLRTRLLLIALALPHRPGAAIRRGLAAWICRAWRLLGLAGVVLARRLGSLRRCGTAAPLSALRGPSWLQPNLDLSELVQRALDPDFALIHQGRSAAVPRGDFPLCGRLLAFAGGRRSIPCRLAPP